MVVDVPHPERRATTGAELRQQRLKVGLSQFRLAQLLDLTNGQLSDLERTAAPLSESLQNKFADVLSEWVKPRKRSPGSGRAKRTPRPPGITTDCCTAVEYPNQHRSPTALALFAGCGGFARGFADAGFDVQGFVELDPAARASFKANFPNAACLGHSIEEFSSKIAAGWTHEVDVLIGGPPCQGFSLAGKRDPKDPRNSLFEHLVFAATHLRPRVIIMENVRLLLTMRNGEGRLVINEIQEQFQRIGYLVDVWILNSADFGVPQVRERVFIVARREDVNPAVCPIATHDSGTNLSIDGKMPWATFREATTGLEPLEAGMVSTNDDLHWAVDHPEHVVTWLRATPEGQSAHENDDPALRPPSGYNTTYKRLRWDEPSSTIGTTFGMISGSRNVHPRDTRSLTIREAARCQSFPDSFVFEGTWSEIRTMIGNAVPPQLAKVVGNEIKRSITQSSTKSSSLK